MSKYKNRLSTEISQLQTFVRGIQFFKSQNIVGKDLADLCELFEYQKCPAGKVIYNIGKLRLGSYVAGDESDKMFILIDGTVEFSVNMKAITLTNEEMQELGDDLGIKDLPNVFHKYKHTHRLYPNQRHERAFKKLESQINLAVRSYFKKGRS